MLTYFPTPQFIKECREKKIDHHAAQVILYEKYERLKGNKKMSGYCRWQGSFILCDFLKRNREYACVDIIWRPDFYIRFLKNQGFRVLTDSQREYAWITLG
ncbi:MAG: hypothetical protein J6W29_04895 [Neisseriaceae bacterium]|nr:hypothetical protein [Neisseriaceae bacterium]